MTYCLAMRLEEGLVFASDTRTNAGLDNISTYRKLHVFSPAPDRLFVLQSAGNLGTTQEVLDRLTRDLRVGEPENLATVSELFEAALYIGRLNQEVAHRHRSTPGGSGSGADFTATFILGGQIGTGDPDILLVYPEGNYIAASEDRPFLQIGEGKYGKFMLELAVRARAGLDASTKVALSSLVSTARANLSVGPPYDIAVYRPGTFTLEEHRVLNDSDYLRQLQDIWVTHLLQAIEQLPPLPDQAR